MAAQTLFKSMHKKAFTVLHCWLILRFHPKWTASLSAGKGKKQESLNPSPSSNASPTPGTFSSINIDDSSPSNSEYNVRPAGKKAAKKRDRERDSTRYQSMLDELSTGRMENAEQHKEQMELEKERLRMKEVQMDLVKTKLKIKETQENERLRQENVRLEIEKENMILKRLKEEERIMTMNLQDMDEDSRNYYLKLRKDIMNS